MDLKVLEHIASFRPDQLDDKALTEVKGFNAITRRVNALHQVRVAEAAELWADFLEGRVDSYLMKNAFQPQSDVAFEALCRKYPHAFYEAMTTSDFASLTDVVLDKMLLANYQNIPSGYEKIARVNTNIKDFRKVKRYKQEGMRKVLSAVGELEPFDRRAGSQSSVEYGVSKYEGGYALSWEDLINDDLGIFQQMPRDMAQATRHTHDRYATSLYVGTAGPLGTLYTADNGNIITSNPELGLAGLQTAFGMLMDAKDSDGLPMVLDMATLVVGSGSLFVTARNLMNSLMVDYTEATGKVLKLNNWIVKQFELVYNPWISQIATSNAATSWFLFANPNSAPRPAIEIGFLQGYQAPALYRKAGNSMRIGGGIDEQVGDFETMGHEYKVLTTIGGTVIEPKATVASNGTKS